MKVICTLPNASELISDIKFAPHAQGMISEEIADDIANLFLSIPGYITEEAAKTNAEAINADAVRAELTARAAAVGLSVKGVWGNDRLLAEVEKAEKATTQAEGSN